MSFLLSLFAIVAVQKNVRDTLLHDATEREGASEVQRRP